MKERSVRQWWDRTRPDKTVGSSLAGTFLIQPAPDDAGDAAPSVEITGATPAEPEERKPMLVAHPFRVGFVGGLGVLLAYITFLTADVMRTTLLIIAVAGLLAIGLDPAVRWLVHRRVRRGWAVTIVFLLVMALFAGAVLAILPPVINELSKVFASLPTFLAGLSENPWLKDLEEQYGLITYIENSDIIKNLGSATAGGLLEAGVFVAAILGDLLIILVLTLFFLAGLPKIKQGAYRLAPGSRRARVTELGDQVVAQMGGYLSGAFLVALQAGVVAGVFAAIVGLPYPWAIGLGAFVLDFIPVVGPIIVGVAMTLIGFTQSLTLGIVAGGFYIVQHLFEAYWLYPRIMRSKVNISTGAVVLAIIAGAALFGVVGALLAVPVAAGVQLIFREVVLPAQDRK